MSNSHAADRGLLNNKNRFVVNKWKNDPLDWKKYRDLKNGSFAERRLLYRMPLELGPGSYADVGVLKGQSTACLMHGIHDIGGNGTVYAVDLFGTGQKNESGFKQAPEWLKNYRKEQNLSSGLEILIGDSAEWGRRLNTPFRFVFIDADHSYAACKRDWEAWSRLVEVGGCVAFHDCHMLDVNRVISEIPDNWKLIEHVYSTKLFQRMA